MSVNLVKHTGGCHCGKVRFEVLAKPELRAYDCKWVVVHSLFLKFLEINIQLSSTLNSQFLKGFCLKRSIPFPFFSTAVLSVSKREWSLSWFQRKISSFYRYETNVSFPLTRDLLFSENQARSPTRPRIINKKYIFLLISRIIHNFIVSVNTHWNSSERAFHIKLLYLEQKGWRGGDAVVSGGRVLQS